MTFYNQIAIPVADVAPVQATQSADECSASLPADNTISRARQLGYAALVVWTLIHFTAFCYFPELGPIVTLLVVARYLLWLAVMLAVMLHMVRRGGGELGQVIAPIMGFFVIGVLSSLIGYEPLQSARLLVFWLLGMLAAAVGGLETREALFRRTLFVLFAVMIAASILFVLVKPELGMSADNRVGGGYAWRGLFPGKNLFGLIAVYMLMLSILTVEWAKIVRLLAAAASIGTLVFAQSQGASLTAVAMVGYIVLVWGIRRLPISGVARSAVLAGIIVAITLFVVVGLSYLLTMLNRDPSLTGRSSVWPQWFARAATHWLTGYGPGSFTEISFVTIDLAAADAGLGMIHTPHNMFIAIFGEVGIFGLLAFVLPLLYFVIILPFAASSRAALLVGGIGLVMLVGGISETREVFGLGMNMFLLLAAYANYRRGVVLGAGGASDREVLREQASAGFLRSVPALGD